jgi:hypothetical protein
MKPKLDSLLTAVNDIYPGQVMVRVGQEASGELHVGAVEQSALGTRLLLEVPDATAADFQIGTELLQMLLQLNNAVPQIFFALTFDKEALDDQLIQIATRLYRIVLHAITYPELAQKGLLTDEVKAAYLAGIRADISPEEGELDDQSLWRLLVLLDALVFLADDQDAKATLQAAYPLAYKAAQDLIAPILQADLTQGRQVRKRIVALFTGVDDVLMQWGKPTVNAREYVTVSVVLSERQLQLPVKQVFDIFHSEMLDFRTKERAYVGLTKSDRQNSFVLSVPETDNQPAYFTALYAMTVKELFDELGMPYLTR